MSTIMKGAASNAVESDIEIIRSRMLLMGGTAVEMIKCSLDGLLNVPMNLYRKLSSWKRK